MSELQIFQILGLLFFTAGLGLLINGDFYKRMFDNFADSPLAVFVGGVVSAAVGYYLIASYSVWVWDWALLVTLVGWVALIKGIFMLLFPRAAISLMKEIGEKYLPAKAVGAAVIGFILLALGFFWS